MAKIGNIMCISLFLFFFMFVKYRKRGQLPDGSELQWTFSAETENGME